jgi:hypothetical protein
MTASLTQTLLNVGLPTCHADWLMQGVPCTGTRAVGLTTVALHNSTACRVSCACCSGVLQSGEVTKILVEAALDGLAAQCLICPALHTQQVGQQVNGACAALADYRAVHSTKQCMELVGRRC